MSRLRRWLLPGILAAAALLSASASAWETSIADPKLEPQWGSLYYSLGDSRHEMIYEDHNEHAALSILALRRLGLGDDYVAGARGRTLIDLNELLFRDFLGKEGTYKLSPQSGRASYVPSRRFLGKRAVPPAYHFAGLPDFSYALHDWVNKNHYCAALPEKAPNRDKCHDFAGWLGAAFNSSHFGTQAVNMYRRYHKIALLEAARAQTLRKKLESSDHPADLNEYERYVRAAEEFALIYESIGQHFLQDRWAVSHMWERWNAGGYGKIAHPRSLALNFEIGMVTGLIHGSESVFGAKDPMASPFHASKVDFPEPVRWADRKQSLIPGVGDHRLGDMLRGQYDSDLTGESYALAVHRQEARMTECLATGYAEVIRAFGEKDGGYGLDSVHLPGDIGTFADQEAKGGCFRMWATNRAMARGYLKDDWAAAGRLGNAIVITGDTTLSDLVTANKSGDWKTVLLGKDATGDAKIDRKAWVRLGWYIARGAKERPDATDLARGTIMRLMGARTGNHYARGGWVPDYVEPEDLDSLPQESADGRDRRSIYGLFNQARADQWCHHTDAGLFERLRGGSDETIAACLYLADRMYEGTVPDYDGDSKEMRRAGEGEEAPRVHSLCYHHDLRFGEAYNDRYPVRLPPSLIATPYAVESHHPQTAWAPEFLGKPVLQSLLDWCRRAPVLTLIRGDKKSRDDDVVAQVEPVADGEKAEITLRGFNLGNEVGKLSLSGRGPVWGHEISEWSDEKIVFELPAASVDEERDFEITLVRADDVALPGRAVLRVKKPAPVIVEAEIDENGRPVYVFRGSFDDDEFLSREIEPGGTLDILLTFSRDMDTDVPVGIRIEAAAGDLVAQGGWQSARLWEGRIDLPAGDAFADYAGGRALAVTATAADGQQIDGDPDKLGPQPSRRHILNFPQTLTAPAFDLTGCWVWDGNENFTTMFIEDKGSTLDMTLYPGTQELITDSTGFTAGARRRNGEVVMEYGLANARAVHFDILADLLDTEAEWIESDFADRAELTGKDGGLGLQLELTLRPYGGPDAMDVTRVAVLPGYARITGIRRQDVRDHTGLDERGAMTPLKFYSMFSFGASAIAESVRITDAATGDVLYVRDTDQMLAADDPNSVPTMMGSLDPDHPIHIEVKVNDKQHCPFSRETYPYALYWGEGLEPQFLLLEETAPDSGVFKTGDPVEMPYPVDAVGNYLNGMPAASIHIAGKDETAAAGRTDMAELYRPISDKPQFRNLFHLTNNFLLGPSMYHTGHLTDAQLVEWEREVRRLLRDEKRLRTRYATEHDCGPNCPVDKGIHEIANEYRMLCEQNLVPCLK